MRNNFYNRLERIYQQQRKIQKLRENSELELAEVFKDLYERRLKAPSNMNFQQIADETSISVERVKSIHSAVQRILTKSDNIQEN